MDWFWTIVGALLAGVIIGPLARLVLPGKQDISLIGTILYNLVPAFPFVAGVALVSAIFVVVLFHPGVRQVSDAPHLDHRTGSDGGPSADPRRRWGPSGKRVGRQRVASGAPRLR